MNIEEFLRVIFHIFVIRLDLEEFSPFEKGGPLNLSDNMPKRRKPNKFPGVGVTLLFDSPYNSHLQGMRDI